MKHVTEFNKKNETVRQRALTSEEAFLLSTQSHPGGAVWMVLDKEFDVAEKIIFLERLAKKIAETKSTPDFFMQMERGIAEIRWEAEQQICNRLIDLLRTPGYQMEVFILRYRLHPLSDMFLRLLLEYNMFGFDENVLFVNDREENYRQSIYIKRYCSQLNQVVKKFLMQASCREGGKLSKNFTRGAYKNYKSLMGFLENIFSFKSRILVLRVDFLYRDKFGVEEFGGNKVYEKVNLHRKDLIDAIRAHYKDGIIGYAWKLEYGLRRGYHYHMLFFFDGAKHQSDVSIGMHIGRMWVNVTDYSGTFHNCNAYKHQYSICGIGMLKHDAPDLEARFDVVASYLTKADHHCRLILPGKQRSFQTSFLKRREGKKGRPRRAKH